MNAAFLKTLLAIRSTGSFSGAAEQMNLSHSAVSVQMRRLEDELGRDLFVKGKRPAQLTPFGVRFCDMATGVVTSFDRLMRSAAKDSVEGTVRIGFVTTTLQTLLPVVLDTLAKQFADLKVNAVSGLSDELADMVENHDLDFAFVSEQSGGAANTQSIVFAREPLYIVAPRNLARDDTPRNILASQPFIAFDRRTRLGAMIDRSLRESGITINRVLELDSIDAIEFLVGEGRGISVVPQRLFAPDLSETLRKLPYPFEASDRVLALIMPEENDRASVTKAILGIMPSQGQAKHGADP